MISVHAYVLGVFVLNTNPNDFIHIIPVINQVLQGIIFSPPGLLPLVHDFLRYHVKSSSCDSALDQSRGRKPGENDGGWCGAMLDGLEEMESLLEQRRVIGNLVTADHSHCELENDFVDADKGIRHVRRGHCQLFQSSICVLNEVG